MKISVTFEDVGDQYKVSLDHEPIPESEKDKPPTASMLISWEIMRMVEEGLFVREQIIRRMNAALEARRAVDKVLSGQ